MTAEDRFYDEPDDCDPTDAAFCRYCGATELTWDQLPSGQWRLLNPSGRVHNCKPFRATRVASPNDFEDLSDVALDG